MIKQDLTDLNISTKKKSLIKEMSLIIQNWKKYKWFAKRKKGEKTFDFAMGPGFYITVGLIGYNPIGKVEEWPMQSGRTAVVELIDLELFRDPENMIKSSKWMLLGYEGLKKINECSFKEFLEQYSFMFPKSK
jgi:hypothetical protein